MSQSQPFSIRVVSQSSNVVYDSDDLQVCVLPDTVTIERKLLGQGIDTMVKRVKDVNNNTG